MSSADSKNSGYSFASPAISVASTKEQPKSKYSFAQAPQAPAERPPVGAEIGPDPRNANATLHLPDHPVIVDKKSGVRYDFHHGARVEMPQIPGNYRFRAYDLDSDTLIAEAKLNPGQLFVTNYKYFIRYRLTVERNQELIFLHDYDCTDRKVMVMVPDGGLGDNLAWMPYAEAFRVEHHAKVTCACGEWLIRLVKEQYPELEFVPVGTQPSSKDFYACYFCAIFPKERKSWRPSDHQNFGMQGSVAKLLGVEPVPRKTLFKLDAPRTVAEPYVVISTMATNPAKYWNYPDGWNMMCRYLKRLGYRVMVIDRDPTLYFAGKRYDVPGEAEDWTGWKPLSERMALLQHAAFFVGLPSGLSWLAWCCNVPVVMLSGFTLDGSEFPTPYRVTNFNFCHGCWNDSNLFFDMKVPVWCPRHVGTPREIECTRAITPKMVINTLNRIPDVAQRLAAKKAVMPEVSVIITSCHGEYLPETLQSIERLMQKSQVPLEIILYDDATKSDANQLLFDRLQAIYPDILQIYHGKITFGPALGRNEAIRHTRAKYLLIFDDDDIMLPFDLRKALDFLEAHPEIPMSYAAKYLFSRERGFLNEIHGAPLSQATAFFAPKVNINAALIRKAALLQAGGFQPVGGNLKTMNEDTELILRLSLTGEIHFDPEPRSLYRIHDKQLTAKPSPWPQEITRSFGEQNPELYERILKGDIPDVHGENFRLVRGLMGSAFFFNQPDRAVTDPIVQVALKEFPEDYGAWEIYFYTLAHDGKEAEYRRELPQALERFKDTPAIQIELFQPYFLYCNAYRKAVPPELQKEFEEIRKRHLQLPEIVRNELKRLGFRA